MINLSPEIAQRFIDTFVDVGSVNVAYHYTDSVVCILKSLGYGVEIVPMTYTRVMSEYEPDRNFDVIRGV